MPTLPETVAIMWSMMSKITDLSGRPLSDHCLRVANAARGYGDEELVTVALLHDLIEDTPTTLADLIALGYSPRVVKALALLTHDTEAVTYREYVEGLIASGNADAIIVKYLDNKDNTLPWRMESLTPERRRNLSARYASVAKELREAVESVLAGV